MTPTPFFTPGPAQHSWYTAIRDRDEPRSKKTREFIEQMWLKYEPYADSHFLQEARRDFKQRVWEMYLACSLINEGFSIQSKDQGPDIFLQHKGLRIWFEAVAPKAGEGDDAVRTPEPARMKNGKLQGLRVDDVPDKEAMLRYRSAIEGKYEKYKKYIDKEILQPDDCYIIAVNGSDVLSPPREIHEIPRIVRAVFPFGSLKITLDYESGDIVSQDYAYQDTLEKSSGCQVKKDIFCDPEYSGISAILHSQVHAGNFPQRFGEDFIIVQNPLAKNRLPLEFIKLGKEYWVEDGELKCADYRQKDRRE